MDIINNSKNIIIKNKNKIQLIPINEVLFVEKFGNVTIIKTKDTEFQLRISLKDLIRFLPQNFIRCHRSFIINKNLIAKLEYIKNSNSYKVFFNYCDYDYALSKKEKIIEIINDRSYIHQTSSI